jgi:hypothetical protein
MMMMMMTMMMMRRRRIACSIPHINPASGKW